MKLYFAQKENGYFSQYAQNLKTGFILFMQIVDYPLTKLSVDLTQETLLLIVQMDKTNADNLKTGKYQPGDTSVHFNAKRR